MALESLGVEQGVHELGGKNNIKEYGAETKLCKNCQNITNK